MGSEGWDVPQEQADLYLKVVSAVRSRGIPFVIGGAFGYGAHTGAWRNTKDLDFYIRPSDRQAMIEVLSETGLVDYYDQLPYDRGWIYRSFSNGIIVDAIWGMANRRAEVDEGWLQRGPEFRLNGARLTALPIEELIWAKLYVVQRERCDWPDVMNLIAAAGAALDWEHLLRRIGTDTPVLRAVLSLFAWIAPGKARRFPTRLWKRVGLPEPDAPPADIDNHRAGLLDLRPWFLTSNES